MQVNVATPLGGMTLGVGGAYAQPFWTERLFDCCKDPQICLISWFCPCVQYGINASMIDGSHPALNCCIYTVCCYLLYAGVCCAACKRQQLRMRYGILTGECADGASDWIVHCCCHPCGLAQEARELRYRLTQPVLVAGIVGGPAVMVQQPMMQQQPMYAQQPQYATQPMVR